MKKLFLMLSLLFLSACAVDKCNDYYVAHTCVDKYGNDCREHYLDMFNYCKDE